MKIVPERGGDAEHGNENGTAPSEVAGVFGKSRELGQTVQFVSRGQFPLLV